MRKRQKMVISASLLTLGLVVVQSLPLDFKYIGSLVLALLTWVLSGWSLKEGLSGVEWLTVLLPLGLFTASVGFFYVLLPPAWWAQVLIDVLFGIGMYILLLTANIFSVAAIRTIALFRSAMAVGFAMTLLTAFLMFDTILSFRWIFWQVGLVISAVSFLLLLPGLWEVRLDERLNRQLLKYSCGLSMLMGLLGMTICFWPISVAVASLCLCTMLYVFLGITQHYFSQRLFVRTVWEYLTVGLVVLVTTMLTSGWGV